MAKAARIASSQKKYHKLQMGSFGFKIEPHWRMNYKFHSILSFISGRASEVIQPNANLAYQEDVPVCMYLYKYDPDGRDYHCGPPPNAMK